VSCRSSLPRKERGHTPYRDASVVLGTRSSKEGRKRRQFTGRHARLHLPFSERKKTPTIAMASEAVAYTSDKREKKKKKRLARTSCATGGGPSPAPRGVL